MSSINPTGRGLPTNGQDLYDNSASSQRVSASRDGAAFAAGMVQVGATAASAAAGGPMGALSSILTNGLGGGLAGAESAIAASEALFQRTFALQMQAQKFSLESDLRSNVAKTIHDANKNTVQNIRA